MPTKYTGRVLTILVVMYIALSAIYPRAPFSIFLPISEQAMSWSHNLRPGIDMVGGTSLLYEIDAPEGVQRSGLAEQVATALKRRVDPQGVRNLIWRPQGDTRLEIQMPLTGNSKAAEAIRDEYLSAQGRLSDLNVTPAQVLRVIESSEGEAQEVELARLAQGSEARRAVFADLVAAHNRLKNARESGIIPEIEAAQSDYAAARAGIQDTNLNVEQVNVALDADVDVRRQRMEEFAERNGGFPQRQEALEAYAAAYDRYKQVRDDIADTASLKRLLQGSGVLAFHIVAIDLPATEYAQWVEKLMTSGPRPRAGDPVRWLQVERESAASGYQTVTGPDGNRYMLVHTSDAKSLDDKDDKWGLQRAGPGQDDRGGRAVSFVLDAMGGRLFGELSGAHVGQPLAIVLDEKIISAPRLDSAIHGSGIITGGPAGFSDAEAEYLINTLNAGALPAQLSKDPIAERTVGPQLGEDNLRAGLIACAFGILIVAGFMISYYYLSGVVATIAVLMNMTLILGSMAAMNATFTLPSIAGIILALGMSVDANVLIFERLREEQARGLSLRMALRNAYDRALSAILDSNITTGITALILYVFGSEEVAGFGLTLLIGIFASLFTALFVTKTIFGILVDKVGLEDLRSIPRTFPKWNRLLTPNIDWMSKAPYLGTLSLALIVVGCVLFGVYFARDRVLDIEFAGGTTAQFDLREPTRIEEIRSLLADESGPLQDAQIVAIEPPAGLPNNTSYEVVVPEKNKAAVTAAIVERLGTRLNMREASTFSGYDSDYDQVVGHAVYPIEPNLDDVGGLTVSPNLLATHAGGVAIVLRDMQPMLSAEHLQERFNQQRLKGVYDAEGLRGSVNVDVEDFPEQKSAVLLISNDRYVYDAADADIAREWRLEFADPAWTLMRDAVSNPDELQKVTNIGSQVAGEFKRDALIAMVLSVLAIVAYIWLRFGDLKFGGATVLALLHDTLFVIAAIGYAHLLTEPWLLGGIVGDLLLLNPFRLNLTMVAAILTVMGFSMNDTVVVFDRIRENRGKYGKLTRQVVNDSINQTLSRTLLTGGTTLCTIFLMYVIGGPGIHGFTFAMLVGIVTGTYSSIAIASPVLLWGHLRERVPAGTPVTA